MNKVTNNRGFTFVETLIVMVILLFIIGISLSLVDKVTTSKISNDVDNSTILQKSALFSKVDNVIYDMKTLSDINMKYNVLPTSKAEELKDDNLDTLTLTATQVNEEGHIIRAIMELRETKEGVKLSYTKTREKYIGANLDIDTIQRTSDTFKFLTSMRITSIDTLCTDSSLSAGVIDTTKCIKVNNLVSVIVNSDHRLKLGDKSSSFRREFYYGRDL